MQFIRRLSFQNKIILVTLVMLLFVVVTGAVAIDRLILPAMERDLEFEARRVNEGVLSQVLEIPAGDLESQAQIRLTTLFRVRPKLLYVELFGAGDQMLFRMGKEAAENRIDMLTVDDRKDSQLFYRGKTPHGPIYEIVTHARAGHDAEKPLTVRTGFSAISLHELSRQLFQILLALALILLGVSFFITRWFTRMIVLPVNQLLTMAHRLAAGRLEEVVSEVEAKLPCSRAGRESRYVFEDKRGDFSPYCAQCPLTSDAGVGGDRPTGPEQSDLCAQCTLSKRSGKDELSRLLLAFQCMAAGISVYQHKLQLRYEFEQRLLDACPDGIIANDRDGRIILYNKGAERLLGYETGEVLQKISVEQIYPPKEAHAVKKALLSEGYGGRGVLLDYSTEVIRKDGRSIPIRLSAALLYKGSEVLAVVGFFHDLTELRQYMDAIIQANRNLDGANKQLSRLNRHYMEMLSFVTHELKSPVANAFMSANALKQGIFGELTREQNFMVEAVCRNLTQSMEMIRHYLDLSRIERDELPIQKRPTMILQEVVDPVLKGMGSAIVESRIQVETHVPEDLEWNLDPELFRGVITNLLGNALKYGEESGRIRITAKRDEGRLRIEIWNSGPGIREEDRHRLFQRFQRLQGPRTASTRGTGLGLFITRTIVERHGGTIRSEGEEGAWISFVIELPGHSDEGATAPEL
jgi:PAS domain S-box-containing protein